MHDRVTGVTTRVSVDSAGTEANGDSFNAAVNGRVVAFESDARNPAAGDTNRTTDIFVHQHP